VIGRNAAVVDGFHKIFRFLSLSPGCLSTFFLEFDNKLVVLIQWGWNYFTRKRGARLITGEDSLTVELTPMAIITRQRIANRQLRCKGVKLLVSTVE